MTIRHVIDFYMDGHKAVSFCKVCSAEERELLEDCPGKIIDPQEKSLDVEKPTAK